MERVRDARSRYFAEAGFTEADYEKRWVGLPIGPITLHFPNSAARKRSAKLHDLHHVATGYDTSWRGEAEIGAWEVAAGCADHYVAWILNSMAMLVGLVIAPRRTTAAWRRGKRSNTLYGECEFHDALLEMSVDELRARLGLVTLPASETDTAN